MHGEGVPNLVAYLEAAGIPHEWADPDRVIVTLTGDRKLRTSVLLVVGSHALTVNAFVARRPDQNASEVHQWLLERNRRMFGVAFSLDHLGDIYLTGRLPLHILDDWNELDRLLGCVLEYADGSFNLLIERGFPDAIRREWHWRVARGESTANLQAFAHLIDQQPDADIRPAGT